MRIALLSYAYSPSVGGIETVSSLVAKSLAQRGHEVEVVTATPGPDQQGVLRRPRGRELVGSLRRADAVIQSNASLRLAWPLALKIVRRPWIVVNHTPIARVRGERSLRDRIKDVALPKGHSYSVSQFLAGLTTTPTEFMPNPYDDSVFQSHPDVEQLPAQHLLFVGRLTRAKGLEVLLAALQQLAERSEEWRLTVVGSGPIDEYSDRAKDLGVMDRVNFLGPRSGSDLAELFASHPIVVMPSRPLPPEAFPIVPLEAIACGAVLVASHQGGLPESVGPCGITVPPDDVAALADAIHRTATSDSLRRDLREAAEQHLHPHRPDAVASAYESAIARAAR